MFLETRKVIPGDVVMDENDPVLRDENATIRMGSSIFEQQRKLYAVKAGILRRETRTELWIDSRQRWYQPTNKDPVIGKVVSKHADVFRVDIDSSHLACLPVMAFEKAVKRNKPDFEIGDLVYGYVALADKDMETEIQCVEANGKNPKNYGALKGGFIVRCTSDISRYLITLKCPLLEELSKVVTFEISVGLNCCVWIKGSVKTTLLVNRAIQGLQTTKKIRHNNEALRAYITSIYESLVQSGEKIS